MSLDRVDTMEPTAQKLPTVSVVIPTYNSADTLGRALESVGIQHYPALEILVVDDGSTDGTRAVLTPFVARGVRYVCAEGRLGPAGARNLGIARASGEFVAFLDADDTWLPGKISRQVDLLVKNPCVSLATCDGYTVTAVGERLSRCYDVRPPAVGPHAWKTLLAYNFIKTPSVMVRRTDLVEVGGFRPELRVGEDLDLWIRLSLRGEVAAIREPLMEIYNRPGSLTKVSPDYERRITLPLLEEHLQRHASSLTTWERRRIRGTRSFVMGCDLFYEGAYSASVPLFWRATVSGVRPVKSLFNVVRALMLWGWPLTWIRWDSAR
jgi:glycosyltransferase involved in cell wall biosynthesis